jgi:hypothetical protein
MDDDLDEEQQRKRRAGVGMIDLTEPDFKAAAEKISAAARTNDNDAFSGAADYIDECSAEFARQAEAVQGLPDPFVPPQPQNENERQALKLWLAELDEQMTGLTNGEQPANQNEKEPLTREAIERDPWNAVALELPADADKALLQEAHAAVMQCCTYMAGPQGPTMNADDPLGIAAAESREQYFERAVRRLDELDGRLRAAPETMTQADADQWRAFVDSLPADQVRQDIRAEAEERDTIALAEAIDDDHRRHRDDPDAVRESAREDRFSSDRIDEVRQSREETSEPLYDRYTGERLDEAGQEHEAGHDLGGGGRGRSLFP